MRKIGTDLPDVWIIEPDVFKDERGFFLESYSHKKLKDLGIDHEFVQDNHSKSQKDTLRGLHFQKKPGQTKLVRCTKGKVWDVIVDIRPNSPSFKRWLGIELTAENFKQLLIPVGYAHGYAVLSNDAEVEYKVTTYYDPELESEIYWDDPTFNIDWKVSNPILSNRDKEAPLLDDLLKEKPDPFE